MDKIKIILSAASCFAKCESKKIKKLTDYAASVDSAWTWADPDDEYDTSILLTIDKAAFGTFILDAVASFKTMVKVDDPIWTGAGADIAVRIVDDYDD